MSNKEPRPQGGALKPKFSKSKTQIPNQVRDDKTQEEHPVVMLNLFQHLIKAFLPLADTSFIPVHRTGFLDVFLINSIICILTFGFHLTFELCHLDLFTS